jgi:hypothetical protein
MQLRKSQQRKLIASPELSPPACPGLSRVTESTALPAAQRWNV